MLEWPLSKVPTMLVARQPYGDWGPTSLGAQGLQPGSRQDSTNPGWKEPSLQGIWQVRNRAAYGLEDQHARHGLPAEAWSRRHQPVSAVGVGKARRELRKSPDRRSVVEVYMPGVPRLIYMGHPFQMPLCRHTRSSSINVRDEYRAKQKKEQA
jgi:hypothetical protein